MIFIRFYTLKVLICTSLADNKGAALVQGNMPEGSNHKGLPRKSEKCRKVILQERYVVATKVEHLFSYSIYSILINDTKDRTHI